MELSEALEQIGVIRAQVARTGMFRGYKAATVGCTGLLAFLAAGAQPRFVSEPAANVQQYLRLWIAVAAVSAAGVALELIVRCRKSGSPLQTEQTLHAVEQFVPCLVAGASATWAVVQFSPDSAHLLPGLWAVFFSLGVFASCRQLPSTAFLIGFYYLGAGVACLALARDAYAFSPWAMGCTFGVGQLLTAAVLYLALERQHANR